MKYYIGTCLIVLSFVIKWELEHRTEVNTLKIEIAELENRFKIDSLFYYHCQRKTDKYVGFIYFTPDKRLSCAIIGRKKRDVVDVVFETEELLNYKGKE